MKNTKLQLVVWLILLSISGGMLGGTAKTVNAQDTKSTMGGAEKLFCTRDFGNFLANGIDLDGEGFVDYWLDFVDIPGYGWSRYSSNYCRYSDIDSLLTRIDNSRKKLRQAFYSCDNVSAQKIAAEYYQLSAEVYYLRHFVTTSNPPNPTGSDSEKAQSVVKRMLWTEFNDKFIVKAKYFEPAAGKLIFDKFEQKYESKITEYQNCSDPNIGNLKQKLKELLGTYATIVNMGKKFVERTKKVVGKAVNTAKGAFKSGGIIAGAFTAKSFGDYMQNTFEFRANGENGYTATPWEQMAGGFAVNAPTEIVGGVIQSVKDSIKASSGNKKSKKAPPVPVMTINQIYTDIKTAQKRDTSSILDMQYLADLEVKYRQTSGKGLEMIVANQVELMKTLYNTFTPIDKVKTCAANIVDKQCGG